MKLVWSQLFLAVILFTRMRITATQGTDCGSCYQKLCGSTGNSTGNCTLQPIGNSTDGLCTGATCIQRDSIIRCTGGGQQVLSLDPTSPDSEDCAANRSIEEGRTNVEIDTGFYIIELIRPCIPGCIGRILLRANPPPNQDTDLESAVEFHLYKRYRAGDFVGNPEHPMDDLFIQKSSFSVTLSYRMELSAFVAVPDEPNSDSTCVSPGDYLGLTLREDIGLRGIPVLPGIGVYMSSPESTCSGLDQTVFQVNPDTVIARVPLFSVDYRTASDITTAGTSQPPTTAIVSTSMETMDDSSTESPTPGSNSGNGGSNSGNGGITTSGTPSSGLTLIVIILVSAFGIIVVVAVAFVVVVIIVMCYIYQANRRKQFNTSTSHVFSLTSADDRISMGTNNSQYMDTRYYNGPPGLHSREIETVENPAVEDDYQDAFEMNAARALPHLPLPPNPMSVTNVHYGSARVLDEPPYQDPDELASTPMIQRNRRTLKNPLYSTTGEWQEELVQGQHGQAMNSESIYDQPVELELKNGGMLNNGAQLGALSNGISIYKDEPDTEEGAFGAQYSLPISAGPQSSSVAFSLPSSQNHEYHELEPTSEVMLNTGHNYRLLDNCKDGDYDDASNRGSLLKSNVHHIVNEPGAYVPNSEERKELFPNDALSVEKFESWKKTSFKVKKFFVKAEEFWVPSKEEETLYEQLSQKKFREIMKDQLEFQSHLGQGQFGSVQKAKWGFAGGSREVAVKIMKPSALPDSKLKFLQEGAIMGQFFHSNVIKLFGLVTVNNPVMIVMEYMKLGDLFSYLQTNYRPSGAAPPHPKTLLSFCRQIACGMKYLSRKHFVHRDLAARNIFVSETLVCKIGDFGMSRNLLDEEYYISHGGMVPIKWTAPEGLNYKKYSTASDVYSYGMTAYEIWSLGEKPLKDIPQEKVARVTSLGYCQPPPPGTPRKIYHIMVQCWNPEHSRRPSFDEVFESLNGSDDDILRWLEEDLEKMDSSYSRNIGSTLEHGDSLYKDLQTTYRGITPDMI